MKNSKVAIILVNYKTYAEKYLKDAYETLLEQTYPKNLYSIYLVDNDTTLETQKLLKEMAPEAILLTNKGNVGWAAGNNRAIKEGLKTRYDYFILANMDMIFDKDWLKELVESADGNKDTHIIQSKIVIYDTNKINSLGNKIQFLGYGYCSSYGEKVEKANSCDFDYTSGASMLIKKEVIEKIGFLKDDYFMYHDDLEYCWRARLAGFSIGLSEKSLCYHKYSFSGTMNYIYFMEKNRIYTLLTHEKLGTLALTFIPLFFMEFGMLPYFVLKGWGKERLKVYNYFFKPSNWKKIINDRKKVQALRVIPDKEIVKGFGGKIVFEEIKNPILTFVVNPLLDLYWKIASSLIFW